MTILINDSDPAGREHVLDVPHLYQIELGVIDDYRGGLPDAVVLILYVDHATYSGKDIISLWTISQYSLAYRMASSRVHEVEMWKTSTSTSPFQTWKSASWFHLIRRPRYSSSWIVIMMFSSNYSYTTIESNNCQQPASL